MAAKEDDWDSLPFYGSFLVMESPRTTPSTGLWQRSLWIRHFREEQFHPRPAVTG